MVTVIGTSLVSLASASDQPSTRRGTAAQSVGPETASRRVLTVRGKVGFRTAHVDQANADGMTVPDIATVAVSTGTPGRTAATLCIQPAENCQDPDNSLALTSDRTEYFVAEDFIPAVGGSVSDICWRGGYYDFDAEGECPVVPADTFMVRYFADAGGVPGEQLAGFSQGAGSLIVNGPEWTSGQIADQLREYEYTATHTPVPVEAGKCYWIEITNVVDVSGSQCVWLWEGGVPGDNWAAHDNEGDGVYTMDDIVPDDLTFCLDLPLADPGPCVPLPPPNDDCVNAEPITVGTIGFDNITATTDGLPHDACLAFGEDQIEADVWYCWTSPCTDRIVVSTCDLLDVDTRIAVYEGCDTCPPTDAELLTCNDDRCGEYLEYRQSLALFDAAQGQSYLIRIGVYPHEQRGIGSFSITCGPVDNAACPGTQDCCEELNCEQVTCTPGCDNETCCETVCMCDPFCCEVFWDASCATFGQHWTECGAEFLCAELCNVCGSSPVDCCVGTGPAEEIPGCSNQACCEAVCAEDSFCCEVDWDEDCATHGYNHNDNGAWYLCPDLCPACPRAEFTWVDPPDGVVDARQPHPPADNGAQQGIDTITMSGGPVDPEDPHPSLDCWSLCETGNGGTAANEIISVNTDGSGTYTLRLARPITPGEITTITYTGFAGVQTTGTFISHPANVNADSQSSPSDILRIIDYINGVAASPWGIYSEDVDHSGMLGPPDILRVIDLLNGADQFDPRLNTPLPTTDGCP